MFSEKVAPEDSVIVKLERTFAAMRAAEAPECITPALQLKRPPPDVSTKR